MKIKFLGAAKQVTGSCYIIETDKARFAIDCGMHQGNAEIEKRNWDIDLMTRPILIFSLSPMPISIIRDCCPA